MNTNSIINNSKESFIKNKKKGNKVLFTDLLKHEIGSVVKFSEDKTHLENIYVEVCIKAIEKFGLQERFNEKLNKRLELFEKCDNNWAKSQAKNYALTWTLEEYFSKR